MLRRIFARFLPAALLIAPAIALGMPVNVGVLSFDEFIPGASSPGINAFNLANFTGNFSLDPDFPSISPITLLNSSLTLFPVSSAPSVINFGDLGPGFLLDPSFNPFVQVPGDTAFTSVLFTASVASTPIQLADGRFVVPTATAVSLSLSPISGSRLTPGDFATITLDVADVPAVVPEPSFGVVLAFLTAALLLVARRKRRSAAAAKSLSL